MLSIFDTSRSPWTSRMLLPVFVLAGAGAWSVDALITRSKGGNQP